MMDISKDLIKAFSEKWYNNEITENMVYSTLYLLWLTLDRDRQNDIIYRFYNHLEGDTQITFLCKDRDEQIEQLQHDYASSIYDNFCDADIKYLQDVNSDKIIDYFFYL